jgi:hypothetical protein
MPAMTAGCARMIFWAAGALARPQCRQPDGGAQPAPLSFVTRTSVFERLLRPAKYRYLGLPAATCCFCPGKKLRPASCTPSIRVSPQARPRELLRPAPPGAPLREPSAQAVASLTLRRAIRPQIPVSKAASTPCCRLARVRGPDP